MSTSLKPFEKQKYLNLETFRKSGEGVKTPVWFAQDGEILRIWTEASTGKAKRIRREGKVRIVPSTASGQPTGEWVDARAVIVDTPDDIARTEQFFKKKYGLMFSFLAFLNKSRKGKYISIQVKLA